MLRRFKFLNGETSEMKARRDEMRYMNTRRPELEPLLPVPVARVDHPTMHLCKERVLGHVYVDMAQ